MTDNKKNILFPYIPGLTQDGTQFLGQISLEKDNLSDLMWLCLPENLLDIDLFSQIVLPIGERMHLLQEQMNPIWLLRALS